MSASRIALVILLSIVTALAILVAYSLRGIPPPLTLGPIGIKGTVRCPQHDYFMSDRIEGALVEVWDVESRKLLGKTYSDQRGRYAVTIPAAARCRIFVGKPPAYEKEQLEDRDVDGQQEISVELLARDTRIGGRVHTESGRPVSGARITTEEIPEQATRSDEQGAFELDQVAAKRYQLRIEHAQLAPKGYVYYPVAGSRTDVDIILPDQDAPRDEVAHVAKSADLLGKMAPALALRATVPEGELPKLEPRVTLLHFFQTYNLAATRHVAELVQAAHDASFALVLVHHAGAESAALSLWRRDQDLSAVVAIDALDREAPLGSRTFARYGVTRVPTDVVIDANGKVATVLPAKASVEEILAAIERARQ